MAIDFKHITNFLQPKTILGASVYLCKSGEVRVNTVQLSKKKNEVVIASVNSYDSINQLMDSKANTVAIALSIQGKGVITKRLQIRADENEGSLLNRCLPNASLQDFNVFTRPVNDTESWVSIIRKELFNSIISPFEGSHFYILDINLGPFNLPLALNSIDNNDISSIRLLEEEVTISEGFILSIGKTPEKVKETELEIDGVKLTGNQLTAFGNAMNFFISENKRIDLPDNLKFQAEEYGSRKLFGILGKSMMSLMFFGLLINFLLFDYYGSKLESAKTKYAANQDTANELIQLTEKRENLNAFIQKRGLQNTSSISYCADQIGASIPKGMILSSMKVNPLQKDKDNFRFKFNQFNIKGQVRKSITLNEWINQIKEYQWVNEVSILNFVKEPKTGLNEFELIIKLAT